MSDRNQIRNSLRVYHIDSMSLSSHSEYELTVADELEDKSWRECMCGPVIEQDIWMNETRRSFGSGKTDESEKELFEQYVLRAKFVQKSFLIVLNFYGRNIVHHYEINE